jgi:23S rRNA (adenine2503-C2)-methyltransferase
MTPVFIYDLTLEELRTRLTLYGEPTFRALQIWQGLYQNLWEKPEDFRNLPKSLRLKLSLEFRFAAFTPLKIQKSSDKETVKTLFALPDGRAIEAVWMGYDERQTLCISTQAGCAMGCVFCATGQMGFKRHLTSGEIVAQVLYYARLLKPKNLRVTNIVIMGMGEPFHNYDATLAAIDRLNHPQGMNLGERRFTISTVGLVPMIHRFADEKRQINLAISLHAATDEDRSIMLPINRKYPLDDLLDACRYYLEKTNRRLTFEWALIQGVNDSPDHAHLLASRLKGMICHINVIPLNPTQKYPGLPTSREAAEAFRSELEKYGIPCTVRLRRGIDIQAGCGQLAAEESKNSLL